MSNIKESKSKRVVEPVDTEGFNAERIEPLQNGIKLGLGWGRFTISFINELRTESFIEHQIPI
jgi:hypothetical protein